MPSYGDYRIGGPFPAPSMILVPGSPTESRPASDPSPMSPQAITDHDDFQHSSSPVAEELSVSGARLPPAPSRGNGV